METIHSDKSVLDGLPDRVDLYPQDIPVPEIYIPFSVNKLSQLAEKAVCTPAMKCLLDMINKWHDEAAREANQLNAAF